MNSIVEIWNELAEKLNSTVALKDELTGYSLTFKEINTNINKVVTVLKKFDIKKQEKVLVFLSPHPLWHVITQGIMKNSSIAVPCDPLSNFNDIVYILEETQSKVLFTDNLLLIQHLNKETDIKDKSFIVFYLGKEDIEKLNYPNVKIYDFYNALKNIEVDTKTNEIKIDNADDVAIILYSSGTTGKPKGAMNTHRNILLGCRCNKNLFIKKANKKCVTFFSASHIGFNCLELSFLYEGNTIIYTSYARYLETIKKYKPECLFCVPSLFNRMKKEYEEELNLKSNIFKNLHDFCFKISLFCLKEKKNLLSKIIVPFAYIFDKILCKKIYKTIVEKILNPEVYIYTFGASIPKDLENFFIVIGVNLVINYGSTELCTYISYRSTKYKNKKYINPEVEVIVCNPKTNKKLGNYKLGLVKLKTATLFKGYYKNEEKTKEVFDSEGYYITGDLGYLTNDNYICLEGRIKDIIVLDNGEKVNSAKVENFCKNSNFIEQIVVVGHKKPYLTALVILAK